MARPLAPSDLFLVASESERESTRLEPDAYIECKWKISVEKKTDKHFPTEAATKKARKIAARSPYAAILFPQPDLLNFLRRSHRFSAVPLIILFCFLFFFSFFFAFGKRQRPPPLLDALLKRCSLYRSVRECVVEKTFPPRFQVAPEAGPLFEKKQQSRHEIFHEASAEILGITDAIQRDSKVLLQHIHVDFKLIKVHCFKKSRVKKHPAPTTICKTAAEVHFTANAEA